MTTRVDRQVQDTKTPPDVRREPGWRIVAEQEIRDLWVGGRGLLLVFAVSVLLSVITYLTATNRVLNFLEQREAVNLTIQIAVAVGVLLTLIVSADGISGERERGTLESLLLTPVPRRAVVLGKAAAALSLWSAVFVVTVPYVWVLGRGVSLVSEALLVGFLVGTVLAAALAAIGLLISAASASNKASLSVSVFVLLALFAPTQLPGGPPKGWFGDLLVHVNPIGAGLHYIGAVLVNGHGWTRDLWYLASPVLAVVIAGGALVLAGPRIVRLTGGVSGE
jgi:ABC-2 type transport system permease protein